MIQDVKSEGTIRTMTELDLNLVRDWRNHENIRQYMYTKHEISEKEHSLWFEQAKKDENAYLLIFEFKKLPMGFVSFKVDKNSLNADWGFYLSPDAAKGTGQELGFSALNYAFSELSLNKVSGEVLEINQSSINFHFKLGFKCFVN